MKGSPKPNSRRVKVNTKWNDSVSKEEAASLDRSGQPHPGAVTHEPQMDVSNYNLYDLSTNVT